MSSNTEAFLGGVWCIGHYWHQATIAFILHILSEFGQIQKHIHDIYWYTPLSMTLVISISISQCWRSIFLYISATLVMVKVGRFILYLQKKLVLSSGYISYIIYHQPAFHHKLQTAGSQVTSQIMFIQLQLCTNHLRHLNIVFQTLNVWIIIPNGECADDPVSQYLFFICFLFGQPLKTHWKQLRICSHVQASFFYWGD